MVACKLHPRLSMNVPLKVFIVEDSGVLLARIRDALREQGVDVIGESDNAQSALDALRTLRPDVVLIDIGLRTGNGFDVLQGLGQMPVHRNLIKIVVTNYPDESFR